MRHSQMSLPSRHSALSTHSVAAAVTGKRASIKGPTLDDMADMLRPDTVLARPPVSMFLKYGIDNPVFDQTVTPPEFVNDLTYTTTVNLVLKDQLRAFLLPSKAKRTATLLQDAEMQTMSAETLRKKKQKWVIDPKGSFSSASDEPLEWTAFNLMSDAVFLVDIVFNFRTGVFTDDCYQEVNMDPKFITWHYLKGWFFVDLVSSIPLDYVSLLISERVYVLRVVHLTKFLALLKLFRLSRLVRYLIHVEENFFFFSRGVYLRMCNTMGMILLIAHWNACLQFFVPRLQGFPDDSWTADLHIQNASWFAQYSWSFFNALSQMLCAGYGGSTPRNLTDMWLTNVGIASGAISYALLLGHVANMIQAMDHTKALHREKMNEVEDYMTYQNFPRRLKNRMRDYFENRYHGRVFDEESILDALSDPLREEVLRYNCRVMVRSVPFLANGDPDFVADLVAVLKQEFYQPGDVIVKQGAIGSKMFFIQSGKVSIVLDDGDVLGIVSEGAYFGELCLIRRTKRQANAIAQTYCNIFTLSTDNFNELLEKYPAVRIAVDAIAEEYFPDEKEV
ncbi:potassium/sodium hyperpolarization-activated cyclic nucleotide-gated channel 1-like isoform X2 [Ornithodoros turicata]|uniref:potassium/sodium hyperpolarization-activated cyclic nucleotide-gated channel 1-like isoform X2 n=1 Tax=Ornithodoros turicata TaxID=34597 RepID=UPI003139ECC6